jgi:phage repressor protein C with HTH and peptisase S24 domain
VSVLVKEKPKVEPKKEGGSPVPPSGPEGGSENEDAPSGEMSLRLDQAIAQSGGPSAVARRAEMYLGTLNRYRGGRELPSSALVSLARATGVRLEWLATGEGPMQGDSTPAEAPATPPGHVLLPLLEARAAAGNHGGLRSDHLVDFIAFSESFLKHTLRRAPQNLALLTASGDSMDPTIRDGDLLLVDTSARDIQSSRVYVLEVNGALLVKRIQVRLDGSLIVKSDNAAYEAEVLRAEDAGTLRILGQVVWHAGPVRS